MLSLKEILKVYKNDLKVLPTISNKGWALDIYSPISFTLTPGCHIKLPAGFGLELPEGIGGIISPKNSSRSHFSVSPGQLIHPEFTGELSINLIYHGRSEDMISEGESLCQIVFFNTLKIGE